MVDDDDDGDDDSAGDDGDDDDLVAVKAAFYEGAFILQVEFWLLIFFSIQILRSN